MYKIILYCLVAIVLLWIVREKCTSSHHVTRTHKRTNNRILSYNIQRMPYSTKPLNQLYLLFRKYSIVLLQESFLNVLYDDIEYTFGDYHIVKGTMSGYRLVNSGLIILSKYPILYHTFIPFVSQDYLTSDVLSEKGFLVAKIEMNRTPMYIINTHLQSNISKNNYTTAMNQWAELHTYVARLTEPWLIGGDFNIHFRTIESNYAMFAPCSPTIYIKYKNDKETDTSCCQKKGYEPYVFDYFITKDIHLTTPTSVHFGYSDHLPISTTFFIVDKALSKGQTLDILKRDEKNHLFERAM